MQLLFPSAIRFRAGSLAISAFLGLLTAHAVAAENIALTVDLTKTPQKLLQAHETMAVKPGPLTIYYPKWIPGEHGPDGPISSLTGMHF